MSKQNIQNIYREIRDDLPIRRTLWRTEARTLSDGYDTGTREVRLLATEDDAMLVGSLCENGLHAPVLDLDREATMREAPGGKTILTIGGRLPMRDYVKFVEVLTRFGFASEYGDGGIVLACPARLVPSSTNGHFHLYLDRYLAWDDYRSFLEELENTGIIEAGFCDMAIERGQSMVRVPQLKK